MKIKRPKHKFTMQMVLNKVDAKQKFVWMNRKTGEIRTSSDWYWMNNGKKRTRELDWYNEEKPFYSKYAKLDKFVRQHLFVGEF